MADFISFFSAYAMGSAELFLQFYFFYRLSGRRARLPHYLLYAVCSAAVLLAVPLGGAARLGALALLLAAGGVLLCHAGFKASFLYAALAVELMQLCFGIVNSLSSLLFFLVPGALREAAGILFMLAGEALALLLTAACYYVVYRYFSSCTASEMQYLYLVFIPILMMFIMEEYINSVIYGGVVTEGGGAAGGHASHWQMLILQLLGIASLFCILSAYKKLVRSLRLGTELALLEQEEHSLRQYVEEARSRYEKTRSFRHDIRNHISVVGELLQGGKADQAMHYIRDMENIAEEMSFPCSTNNPVADILIGNKLGIAEGMGIRACCSLLLPYPCGVRDIDLCIVLSNALDNALHACGEMDAGADRHILVSGRIQGDFLMLEIENSYRGGDVPEEGTGLSNIRAIAEKYNGAMSIKAQGGVFALHVLLIIPPHQESISRQMPEAASSGCRKRE